MTPQASSRRLSSRTPKGRVGIYYPSRVAGLVTLGYLVLTFPLLWRGSENERHATTIAVLHIVAILALWWSLRGPRAWSVWWSVWDVLADWLPLLLVPFLYAELPYLMGPAVAYHDAVVRGWEDWLFGTQPARTLAGALPSVALSEALHLAYILFYAIVYVPPLLLYVAGRRADFGRTVLAVMATYVICFVIFVAFPVEGPRYAWPAPPGVPDGPVRWLTLAILERGSSRGTAFPSSHAAVAAAQAVAGLRYQPLVGAIVSATTVLLMTGAVYGGFHYGVDMLVGAAVGVTLALAVARRHVPNS